MAEEDLIFGKNRHFFGGIEPSNMRYFSASGASNCIRIRMTLPEHTVVNNQTLCSVAGVVIKKSTDGYPKDEFSGIEVANVIFDGTVYTHVIFDTEVEPEVTYYYSAFPYTTQGVYNRNAAIKDSPNRSKASHAGVPYTYLYGFDLDLADENPETRVSYPHDVENFSWGYVTANSEGTNYGLTANGGDEWLDHIQPGVDFTPRPCMLNFDGTVAEYLNPYNYTQNVNGVPSTLNTSDNTTSNAMMEWPKIYTKRWVENGVYKFRCSDSKIDDDWECWCNYDKNGNVIDHFYTAIYQLTNSTKGFYSAANESAASYRSLCDCQYTYRGVDITRMRTFLREMNGDDWDIEQLCDRLLINDLLILITKSTNIQSRLGYGITSSSKPDYCYKYADSATYIHRLGLFNGSSSPTEAVKIFGMVNWYGCRYRIVDGIQATEDKSGVITLYIAKNRYMLGTDYNEDHNGYINIGQVLSDGGCVTDVCVTDIGLVPIKGGGSTTTYFADKIDIKWTVFSDHDIITHEINFGGGNDGSYAGPFCMMAKSSPAFTSVNDNITTSLSCKPSKVE